MADVLDWIARSVVAIEVGTREFQKLTLLDVLEKRGVVEAGSQNQVLGEPGLHELLLDQLLKNVKIWRPVVLSVILCP